jgi:hypothetical protein
MGAGASVAASCEVAQQVAALGEAFDGYAKKVQDEGIDGTFLKTLGNEDLQSLLTEMGVTSVLHRKKMQVLFESFKAGGDSTITPDGAAMPNGASAAEEKGAIGSAYARPSVIIKAFAGFLSHYKFECGTEARLVQVQLKPIIEKNPIKGSSHDVFLDSDNLSDLRNLLQHVMQSKVLVLLQSKGVLTRPWVIMELYTAITHDVPIVALNVQNASRYDYAAASEFLLHFDKDIDIANPGAAQLLIDLGVDPVDVAWRLSDCLPNIISTAFNPNGSERQIQASLEDLADAMRKAVPIAPSVTKEEWLAARASQKAKSSAKKEHGSAGNGGDAVEVMLDSTSADLADVPLTVPELPDSYLVRDEDLNQLKNALLADGGANGTALTSKKRQNKVGAHGMVGIQSMCEV